MDIYAIKPKLPKLYDDMFQTSNMAEIWALYQVRLNIKDNLFIFKATGETKEIAVLRATEFANRIAREFEITFKCKTSYEEGIYRIEAILVRSNRIEEPSTPVVNKRNKIDLRVGATIHVVNTNSPEVGYYVSRKVTQEKLQHYLNYINEVNGGGYQFLVVQNGEVVYKRYAPKAHALSLP